MNINIAAPVLALVGFLGTLAAVTIMLVSGQGVPSEMWPVVTVMGGGVLGVGVASSLGSKGEGSG